MKKRHIIIIITIMIIIIVILGIIKFIKNFQNDANKSQVIMNEITEYYSKLEENILEYNKNRETLNDKTSSYYQESFNTDYLNIINNLKEYDQTISKIKTNIEIINKDCGNNIFSNANVNNICNTYQETYEKIINVYMNDVNNFNNLVDLYNKETSSDLMKFTSNYITDYIDYNNDGKYEEKN